MSKRSQYSRIVHTSAAGLLPSARLNLYLASTNTPASAYAAQSGGSPLTQPLHTNVDGRVSFWAEPGTYDVLIDDPTYSRIETHRVHWEAVSADSDGIASEQIKDLAVTESKLTNYGLNSADFATNAVAAIDIADNGIVLGTDSASQAKMAQLPSCIVHITSSQVLGTYGSNIVWNTASNSVDTMWTSGSAITIVTPGIYLVGYTVAASSVSGESWHVRLIATEPGVGSFNVIEHQERAETVSMADSCMSFITAKAGDQLTLRSAGTVTTQTSMSATFISS